MSDLCKRDTWCKEYHEVEAYLRKNLQINIMETKFIAHTDNTHQYRHLSKVPRTCTISEPCFRTMYTRRYERKRRA